MPKANALSDALYSFLDGIGARRTRGEIGNFVGRLKGAKFEDTEENISSLISELQSKYDAGFRGVEHKSSDAMSKFMTNEAGGLGDLAYDAGKAYRGTARGNFEYYDEKYRDYLARQAENYGMSSINKSELRALRERDPQSYQDFRKEIRGSKERADRDTAWKKLDDTASGFRTSYENDWINRAGAVTRPYADQLNAYSSFRNNLRDLDSTGRLDAKYGESMITPEQQQYNKYIDYLRGQAGELRNLQDQQSRLRKDYENYQAQKMKILGSGGDAGREYIMDKYYQTMDTDISQRIEGNSLRQWMESDQFKTDVAAMSERIEQGTKVPYQDRFERKKVEPSKTRKAVNNSSEGTVGESGKPAQESAQVQGEFNKLYAAKARESKLDMTSLPGREHMERIARERNEAAETFKTDSGYAQELYGVKNMAEYDNKILSEKPVLSPGDYIWGYKMPQIGLGIGLTAGVMNTAFGDGRRTNAQLYGSPF